MSIKKLDPRYLSPSQQDHHQIPTMGGHDAGNQYQFTGMAKYFNAYTTIGRRNVSCDKHSIYKTSVPQWTTALLKRFTNFVVSSLSVFWLHMDPCWAFSFSSSWSPRNRRLSHKSKHVSALPFLHSALPIVLFAVTWRALSHYRSPFWLWFWNQLELDVLVIKWPFGFPVLTINMYAQNVKKSNCFIYS